MMKIKYGILIILTFLSVTLIVAQEVSHLPNVVIIMADDLGYADLSCYGSEKINTPNIDRLAEEGVLFTDFHSNGSVCSPTRASLLTGKYQQRTGITGVVTAHQHRDVGLSLSEVTIAEQLKKAGYVTGMFGKWHVGYSESYNPVHQGFDEYIGYVSGNVDYHAHIDQAGYEDWWKQNTLQNEKGYTTDMITSHAIDFIDRHKEESFLLYIPHEAPHGPFQGRKTAAFRKIGEKIGDVKRSREEIRLLLKEMIEVMDEGVGEIMQTIENLDLDEKTLVFFCSDNGGAKYGDNTPLRAGKASLYEGGHRVAGLAKWKGTIKPGTICSETAMTMDLWPTLSELAGLGIPSSIDGCSLKKLLLKNEKLVERNLFWQYRNKMAMRSGKWKLVLDTRTNLYELYNLDVDLGEKNNLVERYPEQFVLMKTELKQWFEKVSKNTPIKAS